MGDEAGVGALVDDVDVVEGLFVIPGAEFFLIPCGDGQPIGAVPIDAACMSSTTHNTEHRHQILQLMT